MNDLLIALLILPLPLIGAAIQAPCLRPFFLKLRQIITFDTRRRPRESMVAHQARVGIGSPVRDVVDEIWDERLAETDAFIAEVQRIVDQIEGDAQRILKRTEWDAIPGPEARTDFAPSRRQAPEIEVTSIYGYTWRPKRSSCA